MEFSRDLNIKFQVNINDLTTVTPGLTSLALNYEESWTQKLDYCLNIKTNNMDPICQEFYVNSF